jgi:hypothetical protein
MVNPNTFLIVILVSLGISISIYSYKIGIGSINNPGPGLFPFLLGSLLFLLSLYKINIFFKKKRLDETTHVRLFFKKLFALLFLLFFYAIFIDLIGYIFTTFITFSFIFRIAGYKNWFKIITYTICIMFISYLGFTYLGVRLPQGLLKMVY